MATDINTVDKKFQTKKVYRIFGIPIFSVSTLHGNTYSEEMYEKLRDRVSTDLFNAINNQRLR